MSQYLSIVQDGKIITTTLITDQTYDAGELIARSLNSIHSLIELQEGVHELVPLNSPNDPICAEDWVTPLQLVVTSKPPKSRKFKGKHRLIQDHWIGVVDHRQLFAAHVGPLGEVLLRTLSRGGDVCADAAVQAQFDATFSGLRQHLHLTNEDVAQLLRMPSGYTWACDGDEVKIVRLSGDIDDAVPASTPITIH